MARKLADAAKDEAPKAEHNSAARRKVMAECAAQMREIKGKRAELNEQAGDIRQRLRDNGIDVKSWEAALRLADMEDEAARDTYIDGLKEAFQALGVGQQGSLFLDAAEAAAGNGAAKPNGKLDAAALDAQGFAAGKAGQNAADNPIPQGETGHRIWLDGWKRGQAELAGGLSGDAA